MRRRTRDESDGGPGGTVDNGDVNDEYRSKADAVAAVEDWIAHPELHGRDAP